MKEPPPWTISRHIPSRLDAYDGLLGEILQQLADNGWNERDRQCVQLAFEESLTNAIRHGNGLDEAKQVSVQYRIATDEFWATVCDEGDGFDPQTVPDCTAPEHQMKPSGRGLFLMRTYMDSVEFNNVGNCVTLRKNASS